MADPTQPSSQGPPNPELPESHLAYVIEDAVDELEVTSAMSPGSDLLKALLYGWATGAVSARDLALRSLTDAGLKYLLDGGALTFEEVRSYRETNKPELETLYASLFEVLALAGLRRLGRIRLLDPSENSAESDPYHQLARELLSGAATADLRDDRELGRSTTVDEIPSHLR